MAAGLARGTRAGILAAFACTLGTVPHAVAAVTGLAALLHASGVAFEAVKYAGVAYLLWMAWSTWRDTGTPGLADDGGGGGPRGGGPPPPPHQPPQPQTGGLFFGGPPPLPSPR